MLELSLIKLLVFTGFCAALFAISMTFKIIITKRLSQSFLLSRDDNKVDSVDCFDTLLFRYFGTPHELYKHMETTLEIPGFARAREKASVKAWSPHRPFTLGDVYCEWAKIQGVSQEKAQQIRQFEEQLDKECLYPITTNLRHVDPNRTIVTSDTFYNANEIQTLLASRDVQVKRVEASDSGKITTRIWKHLPVKTHLGDNVWSDVASPLIRGVRGFHTNIAKRNAQETLVRDAGFPTLSNNMRWLRLTGNPYTIDDVRYELFNEQLSFNLPLLIWSCSAIDKLCQSRGFTKLMFVTRDCCHLKPVFDHLYKGRYLTQTFHCSRKVLEKAPNTYVDYVKSIHEPGKTLYIDINGTGRSLTAFFKKHMDGEKANMFFTVWPLGMNIVSSVKVVPEGQLLKQGVSLFHILNATKIEMLNYDLIGTLVDWNGGPVRSELEYDKDLVLPSHRAIEHFTSVTTPKPSETTLPSQRTVEDLIKSYIRKGRLPTLMRHKETLWDQFAYAKQMGSRAYFQK